MAEAAEAAPEAAEVQKKEGGSPIAWAIIAVLVLGAIVGAVLLMGFFSKGEKQETVLAQKYEQVDLGQVTRPLPVGPTAMRLQETFVCQPILILNPKVADIETLKTEVERRKDMITGLVLKIIYRQNKSYFGRPNVYEEMALLLRDEINSLLGTTQDGQPVLKEVTFKNFTVPVRR